MKISPIPSSITPTIDSSGNPQPSRVESIRSMRMTTNATPFANQQELPIPLDNRETETTVEATQPLSPQLAQLAKQRRALQQERREFEAQKKALQSDSTGSSRIDVARLKSEPMRVLLENGVTYDQLHEAILSGQGGNSEIDQLREKLAALEQGIDQKFTEKDQQAEKQVLAEMQREAEQLITSDDYEMVRETRSVPKVMQLIEQTYRQTGEVLDVSEALSLVENELFKDAQKLTTFKKLQSQFIPQAPQYQPQQRTGMRTLTNRDTASVPLSAKARAMAAFYGAKKM